MKHFVHLACGIGALSLTAPLLSQEAARERPPAPVLKKGEKPLFVDSVMIRSKQGVTRIIHPAKKLEQPVLRAEMPWEVRTEGGIIEDKFETDPEKP